MKIKFKVKFMDWEKGEVADIPDRLAERYIAASTAVKATKNKAAPRNKRATAKNTK